jgi:ABC-type transport system substrate-binding protein
MDALLDGARSEIDAKKRETMYHNIVDMTLEECPLVYHCNANYIQVYNKRLSGFNPTPQEYMQLHDETAWTS